MQHNRRATKGQLAVCLAALALIGALLWIAEPASATTNPQAHALVKCWNGGARAQFEYAGFSPKWHLTATQTLTVAAATTEKVYHFDGPAGADVMSAPLPKSGGPFTVTASTEVRGAAGRLKAEAEATITCRTPPPPPDRVNPRAHFWGPCGDPFYRAVFDNRRSERSVRFHLNYQPFGDPRRTIVKRVRAGHLFKTGLFDVAGSTRMTIRAGGKLLASKMSAPNHVYKPCPPVRVEP